MFSSIRFVVAVVGACLALVLEVTAFASGRTLPGAGAPSENPRISLAWFDAWGVCPLVAKGVASETKRVLRELGVEADWTEGGGSPAPPVPALNVLLMNVEPSSWGLAPHVLGAVMGESGGDRAIFIFTPNVIRAAGFFPERGSCEAVRMQALIGRAAARVIVHEIVHAVAPGHPHAEHGVMNPTLSKVALLDSSIDVDPQCARAFLSRLGS